MCLSESLGHAVGGTTIAGADAHLTLSPPATFISGYMYLFFDLLWKFKEESERDNVSRLYHVSQTDAHNMG